MSEKKKDYVVPAQKREAEGTSNSRRLRRAGHVPAVIYAGGAKGTSVTLTSDVAAQLAQHSGLLKLQIDGEKSPLTAIVKDLQYHPISGLLLHVDLREVRADQILLVTVALAPTGESVGVHAGGILEQLVYDLEVRCIPTAIPEDAIPIDITDMAIGDTLTLADISLPEGLTATAEPDTVVFSVSAPSVAEEKAEGEEDAEPGDGEPEVVGKSKTENEGAE